MKSFEELNEQIYRLQVEMNKLDINMKILEAQMKELKENTEKALNNFTEYQITEDMQWLNMIFRITSGRG